MVSYSGNVRIALDPLAAWRQERKHYPLLALAARVALVRSASEIASERMFSRVGRILRGDRCRLKPDTLERLVLLVLNARAVCMMVDK